MHNKKNTATKIPLDSVCIQKLSIISKKRSNSRETQNHGCLVSDAIVNSAQII